MVRDEHGQRVPLEMVSWAVHALHLDSLEEEGAHAAHLALLLHEDFEVLVDDGHSQQDSSSRSKNGVFIFHFKSNLKVTEFDALKIYKSKWSFGIIKNRTKKKVGIQASLLSYLELLLISFYILSKKYEIKAFK